MGMSGSCNKLKAFTDDQQCMAVECVAVSIAMYCLIQFYYQIKDDISQFSPLLKIISIKLVIFLSFWQSVS